MRKFKDELFLYCGLISNKWFLLTSIVLSIGLSSCVAPRSVRYEDTVLKINKNVDDSKDEADEEKKDNDNNSQILKQIKEFEANITKSKTLADSSINESDYSVLNAKNQDITEANKINLSDRRIPTLREQMQSISKDQQVINQRIDGISSDINEIKSTLKDLQSKINNNTNIENLPKSEPIKKKAEKPSFKLKSDEVITEKTSVNKVVKPKKPIVNNEISFSNHQNDYEEAIETFKKGDFKNAASHFEKLLKNKLSPTMEKEVNFFLAECYFNLENFESAEKHYSNIGNTKSDTLETIHLKLAESKVRLGKIEEARSEYKTLIQKFPKSKHVAKAKKMLQKL